jgi:hypothetical protein
MPQGTAEDRCIRERGAIAVVRRAGTRQIPLEQGIFRENHCNALESRNSLQSSREFLPLLQGIFCTEQGISGNFRKANYEISHPTQVDSNRASVNPSIPPTRSFDHLVGAL